MRNYSETERFNRSTKPINKGTQNDLNIRESIRYESIDNQGVKGICVHLYAFVRTEKICY